MVAVGRTTYALDWQASGLSPDSPPYRLGQALAQRTSTWQLPSVCQGPTFVRRSCGQESAAVVQSSSGMPYFFLASGDISQSTFTIFQRPPLLTMCM